MYRGMVFVVLAALAGAGALAFPRQDPASLTLAANGDPTTDASDSVASGESSISWDHHGKITASAGAGGTPTSVASGATKWTRPGGTSAGEFRLAWSGTTPNGLVVRFLDEDARIVSMARAAESPTTFHWLHDDARIRGATRFEVAAPSPGVAVDVAFKATITWVEAAGN